MKKFGLISFVAVVILTFGILVFASGQKDKEVKITNIEIKNNTYLSNIEIIDLIKNDVINFKKDSINIIQIYAKINQNQYIESTNLYYDDESLIVEVKERKPIAYIIQNSESKFLSNDFKIIEYRKINNSLDLPILRLNGSKKIKDLSNLKSLFDFINDENVKFLKSHISEIFYNTNNSEVEFVLTENSISVKLGYVNDWQKNIKKLEDYWLTISMNEKNRINNIDLRWEKRIIIS
jgi:cell division septal protein FtsQ